MFTFYVPGRSRREHIVTAQNILKSSAYMKRRYHPDSSVDWAEDVWEYHLRHSQFIFLR